MKWLAILAVVALQSIAFGQNYYPLNLAASGITLPQTKDPELHRLLYSPKTVYYKLPQVWQHWIPASRIQQQNYTLGSVVTWEKNPVWGLFYASYLKDFNANGNFPWETTVGLNTAFKEKLVGSVYRTINLLNLPLDERGDNIPILVLTDSYPFKWIYPVGTTVGEIIYVVRIENGQEVRYIQEVRTRQKNTDSMDWEPSVYRPVKDRHEFVALSGIRTYTPGKRYFHFRNPQEDEVFKMEGIVELLPKMPEGTVKYLLSQPFKKVDGSWSPAADEEFSLLPKNYCFSLLNGVDATTCASCHRQTQISVFNLTPKDRDVLDFPDKVGNIRGCDGVFTWYPFDISSVRNSNQEPEKPVRGRPYDRANKVVKYMKTEELPAGQEFYKLTLFVQESLKSYELPDQRVLHNRPTVANKE